ncbi:MAG: septum formation initiator family protein [Bacteroidales bacterium]|nr:septum formation initiator family protein [Bacteroidales bacterium]
MKEKLTILWQFIIALVKNKYLVVILVFIVWVSFFDTYNLVYRFKNLKELSELKKEADFFRQEIKVYQAQYNELFSNRDDLEKFAREQYQMKEADEDLFIIISE